MVGEALTCPRCGKTEVVRVLQERLTTELAESKQRGKLVVGRWVVDDEAPHWRCRACDLEGRGNPAVRQIALRSHRYTRSADGPPPALYVMVMAHGRFAKVGALEKADNARQRLGQVQHMYQSKAPEAAGYPMRLTIVGELVGLNLGPYQDEEGDRAGFDRRWAEVEHLESAMRLVLARRLGSLSPWPDWIEINKALEDDKEWEDLFLDAWRAVDALAAPVG